MNRRKSLLSTIVYFFLVSLAFGQDTIPSVDKRLNPDGATNRPYPLFQYDTLQDWQARKKEIKECVLVSLGLQPMPEKTPLKARVFDRVERSGYSVEKVYFESYPGFYVVGNLYRPLGRTGVCPAILNPHGHWSKGRFEDSEVASVPGRCINFALQGYVAFSYSMMGYNESGLQIQHNDLAGDRERLWGISPMGLQIWNSVRALDFVASLPDVDSERIGVTGASGGGTQTFILSVIDDRIKVAAPVNMISMTFQGGCVCENAPLLRLDAGNAEVAATIAPRPLLMISTSGDWTSATPRMEFPAILNIYRLSDAEDHIANVHFDFPHNYNKDSRQAVYPWFAKWLQPDKDINTTEASFTSEDTDALEVFTILPEGAVTAEQLREYLIDRSKEAIRSKIPENWSDLLKFRESFETAYRHSIGASVPESTELLSWRGERSPRTRKIFLGRRGEGDRVPAVMLYPEGEPAAATLLADSEGVDRQVEGLLPRSGSLAASLLDKGHLVLVLYPFPAGSDVSMPDNVQYPTTYNLTPAAEAVQDILTGAAYLKHTLGYNTIHLVGLGDAGLTAFLAGGLLPGVESVAADMSGFETLSDQEFLKKVNIPLLRRAGDFTTATALIAPRPLTLFNVASTFNRNSLKAIYKAAGAEELFRVDTGGINTAH